MRRPRGPGGRFLTAEEIAAQKLSAQGESSNMDQDVEEDGHNMSPDGERDPSPMSPPSTSAAPFMQPQRPQPQQPPMVNIDYHRHHLPISQSLATSTAPPAPGPSKQQSSIYPSQHHPQHSHQHQHQHHPSSKGTMNSAPITLSSPYPPAVQMHHVPHPHAHARHHHPNFSSYPMYTSESMTQNANIEMQRRTDDMIHFGGSGPSSS